MKEVSQLQSTEVAPQGVGDRGNPDTFHRRVRRARRTLAGGVGLVFVLTPAACGSPETSYNYTAQYDPTSSSPESGDEYSHSGVINVEAGDKPDCPQTKTRLSGVTIIGGHPYFQYTSDSIVPGSCRINPVTPTTPTSLPRSS